MGGVAPAQVCHHVVEALGHRGVARWLNLGSLELLLGGLLGQTEDLGGGEAGEGGVCKDSIVVLRRVRDRYRWYARRALCNNTSVQSCRG